MYFVYRSYFLALNRRHKPFLALLGDRSSYSYFLNTRFENRAPVTYPVGLGKPILPIVFFHMKRNDYPLNRELTNRWLPRGRRRLNTRSSLCACATGCGIISRVVLKEATTSEERFWSRLPSNASKGTFCSEYLLNLTLNPQIPSKYANRSFPETSFYFTECYSRHSSYLSNRKDVNLRKEWPKPFKRTVRE